MCTRSNLQLVCICVVVTLELLFPVPLRADPSLVGEASNTWFYGYYGQMGSNGFFGPYNVDATGSANPNFAALNCWVGNRDLDTGQLTSGTNVAAATSDLQVDSRVGSRWIAARGRYIIRTYEIARTQGTYVAMSPGNLTLWSIDAVTPLGKVSYGKREFLRGLGLQFGPSRTHEYLMIENTIVVPNILASLVNRGWLPRRVMSWFNPSVWPMFTTKRDENGKIIGDPDEAFFKEEIEERKRQQEDFPPSINGEENGEEPGPSIDTDRPFRWHYLTPGYLTIGFGVYPFDPLFGSLTFNDKNISAARVANVTAFFEYTTGDLRFGMGGLYIREHHGPELVFNTTGSAPTRDVAVTEGWAFLQFSNGTFFFGTELDWYNSITRYQSSLIQVSLNEGVGALYAPQYVESWRYLAEAGVLAGPFSARAMFAFMPGPDRRNGVLIDRQPFIQDDQRAAIAIFDPYGILLSSQYGAGVNAPGHLSAATVFGAKIDYAIAANLMVEASFLKAIRNSDGHGYAFVRPGSITVAGAFRPTVIYDTERLRRGVPSIPDRDLGWEVTAGMTWKLLAGWTFGARLAYWKPGNWFNYACIDRSVPGWNGPVPGNNWGVSSDRTIDPIMGFEMRFGASY